MLRVEDINSICEEYKGLYLRDFLEELRSFQEESDDCYTIDTVIDIFINNMK